MKEFGVRLLTFGLSGLILIPFIFLKYYFTRLSINSEIEEISKYECLLLGDSQIQRVNSDEFTLRTRNIASSAEHFYFTYNKLLKIVQNENHEVKSIVLGVSLHSFGPAYDRFIDLNLIEGKNSLRRYLYFMPSFHHLRFLKFKWFPLMDVIKGIIYFPDWGGQHISTHSDPGLKIINKTFDNNFKIRSNEAEYSLSQKKYLNKIDSLCFSNDIEVFICSTPYHNEYKRRIEKRYSDFFYETIAELKNCHHINFLSDTPKVNWMSDANHLNVEGASIYSKKINAIVTANTIKMQ